jgi:hypothetical protein
MQMESRRKTVSVVPNTNVMSVIRRKAMPSQRKAQPVVLSIRNL